MGYGQFHTTGDVQRLPEPQKHSLSGCRTKTQLLRVQPAQILDHNSVLVVHKLACRINHGVCEPISGYDNDEIVGGEGREINE